jgi:hypothetical protein
MPLVFKMSHSVNEGSSSQLHKRKLSVRDSDEETGDFSLGDSEHELEGSDSSDGIHMVRE